MKKEFKAELKEYWDLCKRDALVWGFMLLCIALPFGSGFVTGKLSEIDKRSKM